MFLSLAQDTIKSKMQIQVGYRHLNALEAALSMFKSEGIASFFRGCIPPLWGSACYRGVMISSYEYAYTLIEMHYPSDHVAKREFAMGLRPIVPLSALFSSFCRAIIESIATYAPTLKCWR
jgi:hypothetical protein